MDDFAPPSTEQRRTALICIETWLDTLVDGNPAVAAVVADEEVEADRWFVRVNGDTKDVYSVWFTLGQRTLTYETYVIPAPEENHARFFENLLRRNHGLRELAFTIGAESAVFLRGQLDLRNVDTEALDRILGSVYVAVEQCFQPALRIGFASRFEQSS